MGSRSRGAFHGLVGGSDAAASAADVTKRLSDIKPVLTSLRKSTGTPSFTLGVLHHGHVVFQHAEGRPSAQQQKEVNIGTQYIIGSLTKAFVSAACGILVEEGKLDWDKPLSTFYPFRQKHNPEMGEKACLADALTHSTGMSQIDISWYGADGKAILGPENLNHVVTHIPVFDDFRTKFHYSNWMYSIAGRVISLLSGQSAYNGWSTFIKNRIFAPLGMQRSTASRADLPDSNFAEAHTVLDNGEAALLPIPDFNDRTITGPSAAIWSNVPDMLKWAHAILTRRNFEHGVEADDPSNPLRQIKRILDHGFRVKEDSVTDVTYGFGWSRLTMPSTQMGWLSQNRAKENMVIGADSQPRLVFYHSGQITGYLASLYLFPESTSAVVVLTNAQGMGDASDLVAQAAIQALFDLQPAIDFDKFARQTVESHATAYSHMMQDYEHNREKDTPVPFPSDIVGLYHNADIRMDIAVRQIGGNQDNFLQIEFNGYASQRHTLRHYHFDTYGFPPASREERELRCLVDYDGYEMWLLQFKRDSANMVDSLLWLMEPGLPPLRFERRAR
ncbi:hypothetical protein DOTSEDRAFT_74530 [Dothistroma septosporum NZE10]|uniref:Beta-lactamase-related domain-containing protein n=1 Tax=Dothistroma septosporum (strain NZE10 / CBS 128990) TaxID=675120 RepID=N1PFX1_DOTSN|nr:hypothetical protein DOTSEDRAFT_74530 [Dothistroma septosporum NZE10]